MENEIICENLRKCAQEIANIAETLRDNYNEDIGEPLLIRLNEQFEIMETLMLEF